MQLFETLDDLKPYVFCITDNGGATADRFTIVFSDRAYFGASLNPYSPQGVGTWGGDAPNDDILGFIKEAVAEGRERYIRWIDLPEVIQNGLRGTINRGWKDFIDEAPAVTNREAATSYNRNWQPNGREALPIYAGPTADIGQPFIVRNDENGDLGFPTFREAVLHILPSAECLPAEHRSPVDIWCSKNGSVPLWDVEIDPPAPCPTRELTIHTHRRAEAPN